jgi:4-amino-4-deoxy-L-arabinose transferase-like glycosyltransferase
MLPHLPVVFLLGLMAAVQITSSVQESQTYDEGMHLAAGLSYLKEGDYRMNPEHPPLGKLLSALPVLFTSARLPVEHPSWGNRQQFEFAQEFLYKNNLTADQLLLLGRLPTMVLTMLLGAALAWWTRREFGTAPSVLAVFLFATDPNFIAHGRYVTTDLIAALGFFLAIVTWVRFLYVRTRVSLVIAGLALGLALTSKFSTVILPPILLLLYLIRDGRRVSLKHLAVLGVIAAGVILIVYWPETRRFRELPRLAESVDRHDPAGYLFHRFGKALRVPAHPYLMGVYDVVKHNADGHQSYLLGQHSQTGWWYYFPVAFAVKTPTAVLLISVLALFAVFRKDKLWFRWVVLLLPAVIYFCLSMTSGINIGIRHLLPIYPFLFAAAAAAFFHLPFRRLTRVVLITAVVLLQVVEVGSIHPHYLAFFNRPAGGPMAGSYYLVDSNIDWGQNVKKLKRYMDEKGLKDVCLGYFGSGQVAYYGITEKHLPWTGDLQARSEVDCMGVISVTLIRDVYIPAGSFEWLREKAPVDHIGYSMWVYDLRKTK